MSMPQWVQDIPGIVKSMVAVVIGLSIVAGVMVKGVPGQVSRNTVRIEAVADTARGASKALEQHDVGHEQQYTRIICLLTLPDTVSPIETERQCPG